MREGRREFAEVLLEDLQAEVKRESCGSTSVKLSLGNCVLDDLRTGLEEAEEEKEEDVEEEGSTRESSVDAVLELEKQPHEPRIRRYTFNSQPRVATPFCRVWRSLIPPDFVEWWRRGCLVKEHQLLSFHSDIISHLTTSRELKL